jgi:hypothetical protein
VYGVHASDLSLTHHITFLFQLSHSNHIPIPKCGLYRCAGVMEGGVPPSALTFLFQPARYAHLPIQAAFDSIQPERALSIVASLLADEDDYLVSKFATTAPGP